jgi:CheY-like chemotaxis protein
MPNRVHVLIVEDNPVQAAWFEKACKEALPPADVLVELADNADSALRLLESQHFDLAVCDLAIPADPVSLRPDWQHGLRVVRTMRSQHGGLPIIVVSEYGKDSSILRTLMREAGNADPYGANAGYPMLTCFANDELPECERDLVDALGRSAGVARLPVTGGGAAGLTVSEVRALQVFACSCGGTAAEVSGMPGGLSGAKTLRLTVLDTDARPAARVAAKLGSRSRVAHEAGAYRQASILLPATLGVPLTSTVDAGADGQGGAFYGLAAEYTRDLLECVKLRPEDAAAVVRKLRERLQPVYEAAGPRERTVLEIRRDIVRRSDARDAGTHEATIVALDGLSVRTTNCLQHGDMHGKNVLVSAACEPVLIDYGDVRHTTGCLDPLTLELSAIFHPAAASIRGDWPTLAQAAAWHDLDTYVEDCPFEEYVRACRAWTEEVAASPQEIDAVLLSYCLRQLRYDAGPEDTAMALIGVGSERLA